MPCIPNSAREIDLEFFLIGDKKSQVHQRDFQEILKIEFAQNFSSDSINPIKSNQSGVAKKL